MGYYPPNFTDSALALLAHGAPWLPARGVGVTSIRPGLFDYFLEQWGVEIRKKHFQFYERIGLRNTVVISGFPADANRDTTFFCPGQRSALFRDMYQPIWDNGEHGTLVNEDNPYALYLWKAANTYKGLIKIWEVWNEPDVDTGNGWLSPGVPGNWWDNPPNPCETALKTPAFFYIRALRISYEVIKYVDPDAYVAVGGLGWPSYLDVICRYSDNPEDGSIDYDQYPLKGGAYFDVMSFHSYPHLNNSLREWRNELGGFFYNRHSDAAMEGIWKHKNAFKTVLDNHGYDGLKFPQKIWICSEFNIPRKSFGAYIGSDEAQINFVLKTFVTAPTNGMSQMHLYSLVDEQPEADADHEFSYMGLYKNLEHVPLGAEQANELAYAFKTVSTLLHHCHYDPVRTMALKPKSNVGGAAFVDGAGSYTYVLWAKTDQDRLETSSAEFSFPKTLKINNLYAKQWDFSRSGVFKLVDPNHVQLTGSPVFFTEKP